MASHTVTSKHHWRGWRRLGEPLESFELAIGYAGLSLLADFRTDLVKLDMGLVRDIDQHTSRQAIVRATLSVCDTLDIRPFQGYLLARPGFEAMPAVDWSALA